MGHPNPERLIPLAFYQKKDVVELAKELIGCTVHTTFDNAYCVAQITETEAYRGWGDKACHAHMNRRTKRTEIMYAPGGLAYVYLCYGIHHLFNIVTNQEDNADAILIRAAKPISGVDNMLERRKQEEVKPNLLAGPGNFSKGMGINTAHSGKKLNGSEIWLEFDPDYSIELVASKRIGIDYAEEDKHLPWRFYPKGSHYISKK